MKKLLFNWQILLLIILIVLSLFAINPRAGAKGVLVSSVGEGPFYGNLEAGTVVYSGWMQGSEDTTEIRALSDILSFQGKKGYLNLGTNAGTKTIILDGSETFNLTAERIPNSNLKFGLDIQGGTRALLRPENLTNTTLDDIITTLETRINVYGLRQAEFRKVEVGEESLVMVSIAGGTREEIEGLLSRKGEFKATIPITVRDGDSFKLGKFLEGENEDFGVEITGNDTAIIGGTEREIGEHFTIRGMDFRLKNITDGKVSLEGQAFTSRDIVSVGIPPEASYMQKSGTGYRYQFGVVISGDGAKRFAELTQNLDTVLSSGDSQLSEMIYLYLDNKLFDTLSISSGLRGREVTNPVITGYGATEEEAVKSRDTLKAVLKSGDLPTKVEMVSLDELNSSLGENYLRIITLAGLAAITLVSAVIFLRYRRLEFSAGVVMTMLSEVVLILGFAALTNWNLSSLALAGLIAAIGFGVDDQILIIDETVGKKERYSVKQGLKRAYFMIFGAGATTVFAMVPILIAGFGVFKEIGGFALTTIAGVLIGIFITRPAFSKYVEHISAKRG